MKGDRPVNLEPVAESGWYHGVRVAFVPENGMEAFVFSERNAPG
jgi:hypothetical protein